MIAGHVEVEDGYRYHLDPDGDDRSGDGSARHPWRSLARLAELQLGPGDTVLLRGNAEYAGQLTIGPGQGGDDDRPLVFTTSGEGRARIRASADAPAVSIRDAGCIELRGLDLRGPGSALSRQPGIELLVTGPVRCSHIRLARIEVTGFATGVAIGSAAGGGGFEDVVLDHVDSHANGSCGIRIEAARGVRPHRRVTIAHCRAWDNGCGPQAGEAPGAGIVIGGVEDGLVEYCETWGNGDQRSSAVSGAVGIRCWHSTRVTVQRCISHHNRGAGDPGGAGFELAAGTRDCVLQYAYAYANSGPGLRLVDGPAPADAVHGNLVRFVLSQDDARRSGGGALWIIGSGSGITQTLVHNVTVYLSAAVLDSPAALRIDGDGIGGLQLDGNVFMTDGLPSLHVERVTGLRLRGNAYSSPGGGVRWDASWYPDPEAWLAELDQEHCAGRRLAVCGELVLERPGRAAPLADPQSLGALVAYRPGRGSPLAAGGLDPALRGYSLGGRDLCGLALGDDQALIGAFAPAAG